MRLILIRNLLYFLFSGYLITKNRSKAIDVKVMIDPQPDNPPRNPYMRQPKTDKVLKWSFAHYKTITDN